MARVYQYQTQEAMTQESAEPTASPSSFVSNSSSAAQLVPSLAPTATNTSEPPVFSDILSGTWGRASIERMYQIGAMKDCQAVPSLMFCPKGTTTRLEWVRFVTTLLGIKPASQLSGLFSEDKDIRALGQEDQLMLESFVEAGFYPKALWCNISSQHYFCPNNEVNAAEAFAWAVITSQEDPTNFVPPTYSKVFKDLYSSNPLAGYVQAALDEKIYEISYRPYLFVPSRPIYRDQAAVLLDKAYQLRGGAK
jgi:hypothetical protein